MRRPWPAKRTRTRLGVSPKETVKEEIEVEREEKKEEKK